LAIGCANKVEESTTTDHAAFGANAQQMTQIEDQLVAEGEFCAGDGCSIKLTLTMEGSTKKYSYTNGTQTDQGQWHADVGAGVATVSLVQVVDDGRMVREFAVKESQCSPNGPHLASLQILYQSTVLNPTMQGTCELLK
jgi:hypothetical protein